MNGILHATSSNNVRELSTRTVPTIVTLETCRIQHTSPYHHSWGLHGTGRSALPSLIASSVCLQAQQQRWLHLCQSLCQMRGTSP